MPAPTKMPLASRARALSIGASFIQHDLNMMRAEAQRNYEAQPEAPLPVTHSHEHDLMKVAEWASAVATLRAMAEREASS